jgi:WD40 repeat protein
LIAASTDRKVWIWPIGDKAEGRGPVQLEHPEAVLSMALSPDGKTLLTGCRDGTTRLWGLFQEHKRLSEIKQVHPVTAVAFYPQPGPESNWILTGFRDGSLKTWDTKTGFPIGPTFRHNTMIQSLHLLDRGRVVMSTSSDRNIRFWRLPTSPESSP